MSYIISCLSVKFKCPSKVNNSIQNFPRESYSDWFVFHSILFNLITDSIRESICTCREYIKLKVSFHQFLFFYFQQTPHFCQWETAEERGCGRLQTGADLHVRQEGQGGDDHQRRGSGDRGGGIWKYLSSRWNLHSVVQAGLYWDEKCLPSPHLTACLGEWQPTARESQARLGAVGHLSGILPSLGNLPALPARVHTETQQPQHGLPWGRSLAASCSGKIKTLSHEVESWKFNLVHKKVMDRNTNIIELWTHMNKYWNVQFCLILSILSNLWRSYGKLKIISVINRILSMKTSQILADWFTFQIWDWISLKSVVFRSHTTLVSATRGWRG